MFRLGSSLFVEITTKTGGLNGVLAGVHVRLLGMGDRAAMRHRGRPRQIPDDGISPVSGQSHRGGRLGAAITVIGAIAVGPSGIVP